MSSVGVHIQIFPLLVKKIEADGPYLIPSLGGGGDFNIRDRACVRGPIILYCNVIDRLPH